MLIDENDPNLDEILQIVKKARSLDFSQYRRKLLSRRVMTRVRTTHADTFESYLEYLEKHPSEIDLLLENLTINVTEFFRDSHVFKDIADYVIPELIADKKRASENFINIWSCGCSSGEEAYSILISLADHLGDDLAGYDLKITGTDIDSRVLSQARQGLYKKMQFKGIPEERMHILREKYFIEVGEDELWIREGWSKYVRFIYHDVINDPPLRDTDLVICRNMLMYFDRKLQEGVISSFYDAIRPSGFLILGAVESLSMDMREKFEEYGRSTRIYKRK